MDHDPDRLIGPIRRSDVVSATCLGLAIYVGIAEKQWEGIAFGLALTGGIFAGLSPRFQGHFGVKLGSFQIGAKFARPAQPPQAQTPEKARVQRNEGASTTIAPF